MNKFIRNNVKKFFSIITTACGLGLLVFVIKLASDNPLHTLLVLGLAVIGTVLVKTFTEHTIQKEIMKKEKDGPAASTETK